MRKFVLDENITKRLQSPMPKYVINARFLYRINGDAKTFGHPDHYFIKVAKLHNFTIITRDKGLVLDTLSRGIDVVWQRGEDYLLFHGARTREISPQSDFGEVIKFTEQEHLEILKECDGFD